MMRTLERYKQYGPVYQDWHAKIVEDAHQTQTSIKDVIDYGMMSFHIVYSSKVVCDHIDHNSDMPKRIWYETQNICQDDWEIVVTYNQHYNLCFPNICNKHII